MTTPRNKKASAPVAKTQEENVEIVFDFSKLDLFELLDLIEISAQAAADQKDGKQPSAPQNTVKIMHALKKCYVSSSRPLTGADYLAFIGVFWNKLGSSSPN